MLRRISQQIWNTFDETGEPRATYLQSLCHSSLKYSTYLDIGAGSCRNALTFGKNAENIVALDLRFFQKKGQNNKISLVIADATHLPFRDKTFQVTSGFSVIEHVQDKQTMLKEMFRVSKPKGRLLIQIPNPLFPLELHSGLPFVYYIPRKARTFILKGLGYKWLADEVDIPTLPKLLKILGQVQPNLRARIEKVIYPSTIMVSIVQPIAKLLNKAHLFNIIPFGYFLIIAT